MIIQPVDANTNAYRQGKYEEYESYQRNTKVTNMMHNIRNEVMDIDLQNHI
ncbi:hypothetical protein KBC03_04470 [Patescibacteria group bacterium]|nr:hypothetical protein [Patescibacteria group bacterium]